MSTEYFEVESPVLSKREGKVMFPVSYTYNGGTIINGKWYKGYKVGKPIVPDGYELISMAILLQLNASPPLATMYLRKKDNNEV